MNNQDSNGINDPRLDTLGLASWPFGIVPVQDSPLIWADRSNLRRQIQRLVRRLGNHEASTLHLLWADFGAGKTHTLLYLKQTISMAAASNMVPVYAVLPKAARSFVDVYRAIMQGIGFECLLETYSAARQDNGKSRKVGNLLSKTTPGLATALETLRMGSDSAKVTSKRWLSADPALTRRELDYASLPGKIRTTDDAVPVLSAITNLFLTSSSRLLVMLDEFQRVGVLRRSHLDEINAGLHTYFNDCSRGLSLMLSFSFGSATNISHHLNSELYSRADPYVLTIPALDKESALEFLDNLVEAAQAAGKEVAISKDVYSVIVDHVEQHYALSPRYLMHCASHVFSEASLDLEDGIISMVEADYAARALEETLPTNGLEEE